MRNGDYSAFLRSRWGICAKNARDRLDTATHSYIVAVIEEINDEFDLGQFGFEFSLAEIEVRAMEIDDAAFLSEPKIPKIDPKLFELSPETPCSISLETEREA